MFPEDVLSLDYANLDSMSENFTAQYYMTYFLTSPEHFYCARKFHSEDLSDSVLIYTKPVVGYIFGRLEMKRKRCLHLSAISVAPLCRKYKVGSELMKLFEYNGNWSDAYFIDLFVRNSNKIAMAFYQKLGYSFYRRVFSYYSSPKEDAHDMRKSLNLDANKEMELKGIDVRAEEL